MGSHDYQTEQEILKLIDELYDLTQELENIEDKLRLETSSGEEFFAALGMAIERVKPLYRDIGIRINEIGGMELMQYCINKIPPERGARSVINSAWNRIGNWLA